MFTMTTRSEMLGRIIGGGLLVVVGLLLLLNSVFDVQIGVWAWIIGLGLSAVAFGLLYTQERETWAGVIAYVCGALAIFLFLVTQFDLAGNIVPTIVMAAIATPFIIAWTQNRRQWGLLVPAYVMLAIIPIFYLEDVGNLVPAYVMFAIAMPFVVGALYTRKWALLIPGGIMGVLGLFLLADAMESFATIMTLLIPLILIAAGVLLLVRPGNPAASEDFKPKREG
jgi:hypothetical protein